MQKVKYCLKQGYRRESIEKTSFKYEGEMVFTAYQFLVSLYRACQTKEVLVITLPAINSY